MYSFKPVSYDQKEKIYSLLSGISKMDNGYSNEFAEMTKEEFLSKGIQLLIDWSNGKNLYKNFVPITFYFLYDNEDIVGVFKLRHYLNDYYRNGAGHISYATKKDCRKKGYAKIGLNLAIQEIDKFLPEEDKLIKVCCSRRNFGSYLTIHGNIPLISKDSDKEYQGKKFEICENYIDRKNRILIKTLSKNENINVNNDEYLKNNIKNEEIKIFGAYLNIYTFIGYIALQKVNEDYEIKKINIFENKENLAYGMFNYVYAIARVNKIKNIFVDELDYEKLKNEFNINEKYDLKSLENKRVQVNVKELCKEEKNI